MQTRSISKEEMDLGIGRLKSVYRLFGPVLDKDYHRFEELKDGMLPDLDFINTRLSAKGVIYPQSGKLFSFSLDPGDESHHILKPVPGEEGKKAIFGIRPCDADAFALVKRNFDTPDYKDPYWISAYESTTLVGLACDEPCSTCFCTSTGSGPYSTKNLDILLVREGEAFLAKVISEKGADLCDVAGWKTGTEAEFEQREKAAEERIVSKISTQNLAGADTLTIYDAPFWEEVAFSCINCGTCTFLCPTCWCFDIQDETFGKNGARLRNWDSCMFPLFTLHGSGHNPRGEKVQRVRQRFMHKLKYYVDKYGDGVQCVGCGRCIQYCPVNIDIRKVCDLMNNADVPEKTECQ